MPIAPEYLKSILAYSPESGVFTWLVSRSRTVAGSLVSSGYLKVMIDRKRHNLHRLAFVYMLDRHLLNHSNRDGPNLVLLHQHLERWRRKDKHHKLQLRILRWMLSFLWLAATSVIELQRDKRRSLTASS